MIYGIGVDLVSISRVERVIRRWGDRFVDRVFTPGEAEICYRRATPFSAFALRFAAKEAVAKALGVGLRIMAGDGVNWHDVETLPDPKGKPIVHLHGRAATLAAALGLTDWSISLSHGRDVAVAFVVAMGLGERCSETDEQGDER